jgi:hypothetical protein
MTQDAHLKIIRDTTSSKNKKQLPVGCDCINIKVNGWRFIELPTAGVCRKLHNQPIATQIRKPLLLWMVFVGTLREIDRHFFFSTEIFTDEFPDKHPRELMKQALICFPEATEAYMIEVIAESQCQK